MAASQRVSRGFHRQCAICKLFGDIGRSSKANQQRDRRQDKRKPMEATTQPLRCGQHGSPFASANRMRQFPPPWTVEALDGGFKIVDANGQRRCHSPQRCG